MEKDKRESYAYRPRQALVRSEVIQALRSRNLQWKVGSTGHKVPEKALLSSTGRTCPVGRRASANCSKVTRVDSTIPQLYGCTTA